MFVASHQLRPTGGARPRMGAMDNQLDFIVRRALASVVQTRRHIGGAITLGLGLCAGSVAHAGVPLPVVAETTGIPSLAAVVKWIAPFVATVEGTGRVAAEHNPRRRQRNSHLRLRGGVRRAPRVHRHQKSSHRPCRRDHGEAYRRPHAAGTSRRCRSRDRCGSPSPSCLRGHACTTRSVGQRQHRNELRC